MCPDAAPCEFWNLPMSLAVVLICFVVLLVELVVVGVLKISEYVSSVRAKRLMAIHRKEWRNEPRK